MSPADGPPARNVFDLEARARERLGEEAFAYLAGGSDDERTLAANHEDFARIGIRARRLVDVRDVETGVALLGERWPAPIFLSPVGFQTLFDPEGELATARAAAAAGHRMIVSSASNHSVGEIAEAAGRAVWFQLYPTPDRSITRRLLERAEAAGCPVVVLTVDTPVFGNRERHADYLETLANRGVVRLGNYEGIRTDEPMTDPALTWEIVDWLKTACGMKVVLKGIVTREDAALSVERGADGVIVSNHGGRQLESDRSTIACLPEVVEAVGGRVPVMLDGGVRRGTDIFKALALGAAAVGIGRPYIWGLAAGAERGVARALEILRTELERTLRLAGTPRLSAIGPGSVIYLPNDRPDVTTNDP